jgi:hypothetical protein
MQHPKLSIEINMKGNQPIRVEGYMINSGQIAGLAVE